MRCSGMLYLGFILAFAPLVFYALDAGDVLPATQDPLTLALVFGLFGVALMIWSQRQDWKRMILAGVGGAALVAAQIYGVAAFVITTAEI